MSGIISDNVGRATGLIKAAGGGGKIGQVLNVIKTDTFSDTAASWTDITDLTLAITPEATTSKIWWSYCVPGNTIGGIGAVQIVYGDDSALTTGAIGDAAGSRFRSTGGSFYDPYGNVTEHSACSGLDAPATTSATTYKMQSWAVSPTLYICRTHTDNDNSGYPRYIASLTVMEVLA